MNWWEWALALALSAGWVAVTLGYPFWQEWEWQRSTGGAIAAYLWVGAGGAFATFFVVEFNRWLISQSPFVLEGEGPQQRTAPRIRPIAEGVIERLLFTTLAIVVLGFSGGGPTVVGLVSVAYVVLKGVRRFRLMSDDKRATNAIHSIWGVGVSLAFAAYGGILYHQIVVT